MSSIHVSLPETLKSFVDEKVDERRRTSSEYVRELIHKDQDRQKLRDLLLDGAASAQAKHAHERHFDGLRDRVCSRAST